VTRLKPIADSEKATWVRFGNGQSKNLPSFRSCYVLAALVSSAGMSDKLTPADPKDLVDAIAFSLRFEGRRRVHQADEYMAAIAAERVVRHLERAGFVVMKKPPIDGHAALGRGFKG
jgi:hypothetical protein